MSSASVRVFKRQQVCLPALVAASVEPLLLGSPGPLQVDAPARMPTLVLPTAPELVPPPLTWSSPACSWVQYCLVWPLSEVWQQGGLPQLDSTKHTIPQFLHMWCGFSQRAGSWRVPLAPLWSGLFTVWPSLVIHDRGSKQPLSLSAVSQCSHPLKITQEAPRSVPNWARPECYVSGTDFPGRGCISTWHYFTGFSFSLQCWWCARSCLVASPTLPGETVVRAVAGRCLCCVLHSPSSLSLFLFLFCQGILF